MAFAFGQVQASAFHVSAPSRGPSERRCWSRRGSVGPPERTACQGSRACTAILIAGQV
eukprot:CAMPEP_0115114962 /NCGR_PEP_ID=MMETSP0227-20121206/42387_1 /TAXON_ID=89957 /ORGANISM="Polarella glacialis, Strain CCMP 1383" /LENGTH=57 /DNA_ID=CAMNT_0002515499 /DNA_START=147 /DNA_END=316 /DNA_ORIENTATION=+